MIPRRIESYLIKDLSKKMVFLSGPRQCGKTTLVQKLCRKFNGIYYNWDHSEHRKNILTEKLNLDAPLWVFDELHKYRRWRNFLKGFFDTYRKSLKIIVTGSARLELYGRGGDSLQGRYFSHHLHPFTLGELLKKPIIPIKEIPNLPNSAIQQSELENLLILGGFPEPYLSGSQKEASRWRLGYSHRLVEEEVRSLEQVIELDRIELLYYRLSAIVGSILSINSLREDLEVAFESVRNWLNIFDRLDVIFRLSPYGPPKIKSVKKEQKLYLWDWAQVENEGARFENFIAFHLLRWIHWCQDMEGEHIDFRYFKARTGQEVDFIILYQGKPYMAIEVKLKTDDLSPNIRYLVERLDIPYAFQVFLKDSQEKRFQNIGKTIIRNISAARMLANLP